MKKLLIAIAAVLISAATFAQEGSLVFNNRVSGVVDAPVKLPDGTGPGAGYTAELFLVSLAGADKNVVLTPVTTFRTSSAAAQFYVNQQDVSVGGSSPGQSATLIMRAYNTSLGSYDAAAALAAAGNNTTAGLNFGKSAPFTISLGGGANPPANLAGLAGFSLTGIPVVPEPSTIALGILGAAALLIRRRK